MSAPPVPPEPADAVARAARRLVRERWAGALATGDRDGAPYASLAAYACDVDGAPLFLFSGLSDHTRNLAADPRAALLVEDALRLKNPQTGPRVTLAGRVERVADPGAEGRCRHRFLARHPSARLYAGFGDFALYRLAIGRAHWVGGFGRAVWLEGTDLLADRAAATALAAAEEEMVARLNAERAADLARLAAGPLRRRGKGWKLAALDPEGADLRSGGSFVRLHFEVPASGPESWVERFDGALRS